MLPKFNAELPELVTLGYWRVLVVPTVLAGKLSDAGVKLTRAEDSED
jgi:hypothetical protein